MHCIKLCYLSLFVNTLDIILVQKNKYKHQIKNQASVMAVTFTSHQYVLAIQNKNNLVIKGQSAMVRD